MSDQERRLHSAAKAMEAYLSSRKSDDSEWCQFVDLFADLLHLAQSMGVEGESCYRAGCDHYLAEVREEVCDECA